ncbi:MAG: transposase [Firmicutes bacterium]|nr:transposase [Bacillota bacterium]
MTTNESKLQTRKINRLVSYDYSQNGVYYITICSKDKAHIFGEVKEVNQIKEIKNYSEAIQTPLTVGAGINRPSLIKSSIGDIIEKGIQEIPKRYEGISIEKYVIMPNHIHLLLTINNQGICNKFGRLIPAPTVNNIICQFKSYTSKQAEQPIWQKSFYDHIVRDEKDHKNIWDYIDTNPDKWLDDKYYN